MTKKLIAVALVIAVLVVTVITSFNSQPTAAQDGDPVFPVPFDHPAAPFIETYNYAVAQGATAEFRKMEGLAIDEANGYIYLAMSEINKEMSDDAGDIQQPENNCGIVYRAAFGEDGNISALEPYIVGGAFDANNKDNECDVNGISNPDGLEADQLGRVWVGEDTGYHKNNILWAYTPDGQLKRFASVPLGAEVTGARISPAGDLFFNVQHPEPTNVYPFNRGTVGVVRGFNAHTDDFEPIAVPEGDAQLTVVVPDGMTYEVLARVGDPFPGGSGHAMGQINRADGSFQFFCNDPDGNMFLPINESATEAYLYSNVECRPGGVAKMYISKTADGWVVREGELVDFADVNGTWNNCNASASPWNTGLTGEEYPAERVEDWQTGSAGGAMEDYLGRPANPYDYGYIIELIPSDGVGTQVVKHYAMGRFSMEQTLIMPDAKTAYYGDDGSARILFKYVADEAGVLDAGTLYAGKITQQDGGVLAIEWLMLGAGNNEEIYQWIREFDMYFAAAE